MLNKNERGRAERPVPLTYYKVIRRTLFGHRPLSPPFRNGRLRVVHDAVLILIRQGLPRAALFLLTRGGEQPGERHERGPRREPVPVRVDDPEHGEGDVAVIQERAQDDGAQLFSEEGLICNETPDDDVQAACRKLGADLAAW